MPTFPSYSHLFLNSINHKTKVNKSTISSQDDDEVATIYEDIARALKEEPATHNVLADVNAKISRQTEMKIKMPANFL